MHCTQFQRPIHSFTNHQDNMNLILCLLCESIKYNFQTKAQIGASTATKHLLSLVSNLIGFTYTNLLTQNILMMTTLLFHYLSPRLRHTELSTKEFIAGCIFIILPGTAYKTMNKILSNTGSKSSIHY